MADTKGLFIDPDLHRKIKALAARRGTTMRKIAEELLREELGNENDDDTDQPRDHAEDRRSE
jgi:hypothetical protein